VFVCQYAAAIDEDENSLAGREEIVKDRRLSYLPETPISKASGSLVAVIILFRGTRRSRLLILGFLTLVTSLVRGQNVFNCSSGFSSTPTATCGVGIPNVTNPGSGTFTVAGTPNSYEPTLSGSQVELAIPTADHTALNLDYTKAAVGVQAFTTTYTFIPNGWNISLTLSNNTNTNAAFPGSTFSAGAGCEGSIYQAFGTQPSQPNRTFALMLNSWSPLTDSNGSFEGGGSAAFTYSGTQVYQQNMDPCNPRDGTEPVYFFTQYVSTSPVPLTLSSGYGTGCNPGSGYSAVNGCGTTTGDTYSVAVTYTGTTLTEQMYDITAGGSCPGAKCFTYTWPNISIPSIVDGTTAWVGLAESTNAPSGHGLFINGFSYTASSLAATPTFSLAAGTYSSTQSVTISDASSGSIICYNLTGSPATNGVGGCENGTLYTGAISVPKGQTIYAVAGSGASSYGDSAVGSSAYNITGTASQPTYSASSGTYRGNQAIILTAAHGSVICYNTSGSPATDGSTGCTTGTLYSAPVVVSSNETLYSVAGGTGLTDSAVSSATYSISPYWGTYADSPLPPASPTFSPLPGSYTGAQSVTLLTTTANSYICYMLSSTPLTILPYADSMGGCTQGTLYTGPIAVSSSQTLYAVAGVPQTFTVYGGGPVSSPVAGAYTISGSGTLGVPTNAQGTPTAVPQ
jgi:hypothetical protein